MSFSYNFHTGPARGRVDVFLKNKMTEIVALNEILAMAIMGTMTGLAAFGVIRENGLRPGKLGRVSLRELVSESGKLVPENSLFASQSVSFPSQLNASVGSS